MVEFIALDQVDIRLSVVGILAWLWAA